MPQCNRCRYQAEIEKLESDRKRLAEICGKCRGPCDDAHDGKTFISFDTANGSSKILAPSPDYVPPGGTREDLQLEGVSSELRDKMLDVIRAFAELNPAESILVNLMLNGVSMKGMASLLGLSKQHVWNHWKGLIRRRPIWYSIRTGMIGVRGGGRKVGAYNGKHKVKKLVGHPPTMFGVVKKIVSDEFGTGESQAQRVE